ncbi:MAG: type II toxin-antitoxin system RelB/DinJ family antitoxin [Mycoplasmataceae bacterium]|jgi:addiction module RelB/DinJ family antitoxin|nr:type II toxin-antitoxin system RelB/DinJ family antitoxin [Mycoplasmataceae bacterium]
MQTTNINFKTSVETKRQFKAFCEKFGINISAALNMVMRSSIENEELPIKSKQNNANSSVKALFDYYAKHPKPLVNCTEEECDAMVKAFRSGK